MIDCEAMIFTPIAQAVRAEFAGAFVTGEYVKAPAKFPHISIVETDNYGIDYDTADEEKYAVIMYEVNVYSNKTSGKKSEARAIMNTIDRMMYGMNFKRLSLTPVPNMEDSTIFRLTARYRAKTDGTTLYRF